MEGAIAKWYTAAKSKGALKTPDRDRQNGPYYESPTGIEESPETPGYKGRAFGVGVRQSLPRGAKGATIPDFFASISEQGDNEGAGIGEPSSVGDVGGSFQEGFWGGDVTESRHRKGKRKAADLL